MSVFRQLMMRNKGGSSLNPLIKTVGSPTITGDFIYKNVSANDYIYIDEVLPLSTANSWKIQFNVTYQGTGGNGDSPFIGYYGNNSNDGKSPVLRAEPGNNNKLRPLLSSVGHSNWDINVDLSNFSVAINSTYYLEFGFTGTKYYILDLNTNTEVWSKTSSLKVECSNYISLMRNAWNNGSEVCKGEMDLKTLEVEINENLYFKGVI